MIEAHDLRRDVGGGAPPTFHGERMRLVVGGIGAEAASRAVAHLAARFPGPSEVRWVNFGVGGHATLDLGTLVGARKVVDDRSGRGWKLRPPAGLPSARFVTVARAARRLREGMLYEMEGAGFVDAVDRVAPLERITCLRVVSDHGIAPGALLPKRRARRLVEQAVPRLGRVLDGLD